MKIFARGWSEGFDGPGRRLVFYLKGCNLRCLWCGNPESITAEDQLMYDPRKSEQTWLSCPAGAVSGNQINRKVCHQCSGKECVNLWRDRAFTWCGEDIDINRLLEMVRERQSMFGTSGGVTFSGGEPTLQMEALLEASAALRAQGIHVALETNATSSVLVSVARCFDLVIADLKCINPQLHRQITGKDNRLILENLSQRIAGVIRIPLIDEINFNAAERALLHTFLVDIKPPRIELIRLHHMGAVKYDALGMEYPASGWHPPEIGQVNNFARELRRAGLNAVVAL